MKKHFFAAIACVYMLIMWSCTSTTMQSSWKAPGATYSKEQFKKVMVMALLKDETTRRMAEDKLVSKDSTFRASYDVLGTDQQNMSEAAVEKFVAEHGFDGIVTMRLVDIQNSTSYVPGTYQGGYYGWYGMNYGGFYTPGYYREDQNYIIETNVFSVKQNKVLWSGITSTLDPVNMDKTVDEVWTAVIARMKEQGFIVKSKK